MLTRKEIELEAIKNAHAGKCEGGCENHQGVVKAVQVFHEPSGTDWGWFAYCDEAIAEDQRRGLRVDAQRD